MQKAKGTKKRHLERYNSEDGISLRLKVEGHILAHGLKQYFLLCGQNKQSEGTDRKVWRERRTTFCCKICSVNCFAPIYPALKKGWWSILHSTKKFVGFDTSCPDKNDEDEHDKAENPNGVSDT